MKKMKLILNVKKEMYLPRVLQNNLCVRSWFTHILPPPGAQERSDLIPIVFLRETDFKGRLHGQFTIDCTRAVNLSSVCS